MAVFVGYIPAVCITRTRLFFNSWMNKTFLFKKRSAITHIARRLTSNVLSMIQIYHQTDNIQWITSHELLIISVSSNVQEYEHPRCFITEEIRKKIVETMMSVVAYNILKESYNDIFNKLTLESEWDEKEEAASALSDKNDDKCK